MANVGKQFTLYSADAYSEPYQPFKMKFFVKIVTDKVTDMFDKVLNTPLF